ncbi:MAG TPA: GNAT family N-acetyltransferase [Thermomicrobiaceae bacterium]|nr:GNAT family N-acetyltransferase [Thermomicrobiaceae bacterium]
MDDLALMALRADADFTFDARGRLLLTNEPLAAARRPAPRLFLGRAGTGYVVRYGAGLSDETGARLRAVVAGLPAAGGPRIPEDVRAALREVLAGEGPVAREGGGPAYRFPETIRAAGEVEVIPMRAATRGLARETFPWLEREVEDWPPCFAVVRDGAAVSVCFSARLTADAAEAGVETLSEYRGRGFAAAVTAAWGTAVRDTGRAPLYSTSWDNAASRGIARRLGLVMFGSDATWT